MVEKEEEDSVKKKWASPFSRKNTNALFLIYVGEGVCRVM